MTPDTEPPAPSSSEPPPLRPHFLDAPPLNPDVLFLRDIQRRRIPFTYVFMGLNFLVFIAMEIAGETTNPATLIAFGAKSNPAINSGEFWRFLTPVFIHIGILHLAFNSYALWIVGQQVERLYGSARFVTLYILMGIAGVWGSYVFNPDSVSAGASGAIFGLFGVLLMFSIRNRRRVPAFLRRAIGAGILPIILLNLAIGLAIPAIDNAAHVGGLVAGMALATLFGFHEPGTRTGQFARLAQMAALASIAVAFLQVAMNYTGPGTADRFIDSINQAQQSFQSSRRAIRDGDVDGTRSEDIGEAIGVLRDTPELSPESNRIVQQLDRALANQSSLIEDIRRNGEIRESHIQQLEQNTAAFRQALEALFEWVDREGGSYGIQRRDRQRNQQF